MICVILIIVLLVFGVIVWVVDGENVIEGIWEIDIGGYVQIYKEGDVWVGIVVGLCSGEVCYDIENLDDKLCGCWLFGVIVFKGLQYVGDNEWEDGSIYFLDNGKIYSVCVILIDENILEVCGYLGISLLGCSQIWQWVDWDVFNLYIDLLK